MMKRRILQACSFEHSIQKGMFSALDEMTLFCSGKGVVLPPSPLLPSPCRLSYAPAERLVHVIFVGSSFSVSFLLTLLKAFLTLDDVTSRGQFLCSFAQFCFNVSAILPSDHE